MTYKELAKLLQSNKKPEKISGKYPLIISIDDISPYWVNQKFIQIIKTMSQYNFYGTLGIVTQGYDVNKDEWELDRWKQNWLFFQELKDQGWELASHSRHHDNLPFSLRIKEEIIELINDVITFGKYIPSTFILPFGNLTRRDKKDEENEIFVKQIFDIFRDSGIIFVVGIRDSPPNMKSKINGDVIIGKSPFYVSRIPVVGKHGINDVIENIERSFRY